MARARDSRPKKNFTQRNYLLYSLRKTDLNHGVQNRVRSQGANAFGLFLTRSQQVRIFDAIRAHLQYEPLVETRKRKRLRPNPLAPWELRLGELRVFYEIVDEQPDVVRILAVGYKDRNRLSIGGLEIKL